MTIDWIVAFVISPLFIMGVAYGAVRWHEREVHRERARGARMSGDQQHHLDLSQIPDRMLELMIEAVRREDRTSGPLLQLMQEQVRRLKADSRSEDKRAAIEAAVEEADKGRFISSEAMNAWIDSWDTDEELPVPTAPDPAMIEIEQLAEDVWGSRERGLEFLRRQHVMLGMRTPREVAESGPDGAERVKDVIMGVKYWTGI